MEMGVPPEIVYNALNQSQLLERDDRTYFHLDRAQPLHWKQLDAGALRVLVPDSGAVSLKLAKAQARQSPSVHLPCTINSQRVTDRTQ